MNQKIYLSEDWLFNENFQEGMTATEYPEETLQPVRIPHTCKETPFHYFDESLYQMVSGYRRHLHIPTEWQGSGSCSPSKGPVMTVPSISTAVRWESTIAATPPLL